MGTVSAVEVVGRPQVREGRSALLMDCSDSHLQLKHCGGKQEAADDIGAKAKPAPSAVGGGSNSSASFYTVSPHGVAYYTISTNLVGAA